MMPGPPNELQPMFTDQVLPRLARLGLVRDREAYIQIRTAGIGESMLETRLQPTFDLHGSKLGVAFCAHSGHVDCRLSSPGGKLSLSDVGSIATECAQLLGEDFVTFGDDSLAKVCADLLRSQEKLLAAAETATGGLLANAFTDICSASKFFAGGCVCCSNDSKMQLLDVPECLLLQHGAVSAEAAVAMATGAAEKLGADYGLAITGFSGPCGGTNENPVGTMFMALHAPHGVWSRKLSYPGPRTTVKQRAVNAALDWLRRELVRAQSGSAVAPKRLGIMQ
jgi:nicotinamide-nucleotide amidase